jgi:ectoine hydroxylase-related dioxygenase (phytanoyl-CoA dioxygenase family)
MMMGPSASERRRLDEDGYLVLDRVIDAETVAALRHRIDELFLAEGERAGWEFKQEPDCRRLANLIDKGDIFRRAAHWPTLLPYVEHVLGPEFKLSSLNARSVNPHSTSVQPLHADMGQVMDERGCSVCNTAWMIDDYTEQNGALRVVPGSHLTRRLPQDVLADPRAPHPDEVLLTGKAGSVVVMHHVWHGGLANHTASPRLALLSFYVRRDKPQQTYQKQFVSAEVQAGLSPELRRLLALDDPTNDLLAADPSPRSGFLK